MLDKALWFAKNGWAVIPLRINKKPYLPEGEQKKYLYQAASEEEIYNFWKKYPDAQVGLACGKVSGRTVIDIDEGIDVFPDTTTVQTPAGGTHKIYEYSPIVGNSVGTFYKGIDIRNDGGYIVAAGSHCEYIKKGKKISGDYIYIDNGPMKPFPEALFQKKIHPAGKFDPQRLLGAPDGERNASAASVIGLLVQGKSKEMQVPLWELSKAWNRNCTPPLEEQELLSVFNSISTREWSKPQENTKLIDGLTITKETRDYVVKVPLPEATVEITFKEILQSRQSFEAVVKIQMIHNKEGRLPAFEQRLDVNSASAVSTLCTALNSAYGNKKDGYNWALILNRAAIAIKTVVRADRKPTVFSATDTFKRNTYLVDHFLEFGSPTLIHGDGSTGKSYLCLYMAVCAALGKDFLGKKTEYFKTLYIDHEATAGKLQNRLHRIANGLGVPFVSLIDHIHWYKPEGSLTNEQEIIASMVEDGGYRTIIIDAGASASGGSPMDEQAVLRLFNAIDHIPCAKIIIHHEPKATMGVADDKAYYGTTFWRNAPRIAWRLKREKKDGNKSIIKAIQHKSNDDGEINPLVYSMGFPLEDPPRVLFEPIDDFELTEDERIRNYIIEGEAELSAIVAATGLPQTTVHRRLDELLSKGKIERKREGKKYIYFVLPDF